MITVVPAPFGSVFRDRAGIQNGAALTGKSEPFTLWRSDRSAALPGSFRRLGSVPPGPRAADCPGGGPVGPARTPEAPTEGSPTGLGQAAERP